MRDAHRIFRVRVRVRVRGGGCHSHTYNDGWMISTESSAPEVP